MFRGFGDRGYMRYAIDKPRFLKFQNHDEIKLSLNFRINELINHD
jgi:hypothetical protein